MVELKTERRRVTEINEEIEEQKQREEQKESNIKQKFKEIYENNIGERVCANIILLQVRKSNLFSIYLIDYLF